MYNLFLFLHIIIVIGLIAVILVQRGRSGGLVEALGGVESIFGTKTSSFFVKATVILATLFFFTSITLFYLSKEKSKSLVDKYKNTSAQGQETSPEAAVMPEKEGPVEKVTVPETGGVTVTGVAAEEGVPSEGKDVSGDKPKSEDITPSETGSSTDTAAPEESSTSKE